MACTLSGVQSPFTPFACLFACSAAFITGAAAAVPPAWSAEGNQIQANYGYSVAFAGDVNGDGFADLIVGAPFFEDGQLDEGAAFVYYGSSVGLSAVASWSAQSNQALARFGFSVAGAGDVNGDGYDDVIVGAPNYDKPQSNEGAAFLYLGSATGLSAAPAWTGEGDKDGAAFGVAVASAGDVNGDGLDDVIVGASNFSNGQTNEGRAFVFLGQASGLATSSVWTGESNQASAHFGSAVAGAGDVNADGFDDIVVGAPEFDGGLLDEGRAQVYLGNASGLAATPAWFDEGNQIGARYGNAVAGAGDVNGDGYADVVIGAYLYDNGQIDEGVVRVYHGTEAGPSTNYAWQAESNQGGANLGTSVSAAGDMNGDGFGDVVVGAFGYDAGQLNEGRAFVYRGSSTGVVSAPYAAIEVDQVGAFFGATVAGGGDLNGDGADDIAAGAPYYDDPDGDEGGAWAFLGTPPLQGDVNGDGIVNGADLALLLGAWNSADLVADLDGNGIVNGSDLAILLGNWTV